MSRNTYKDAVNLGRALYQKRCERRTNNTFWKCRQAVGGRREKAGLWRVPNRQVLKRENKWESALEFLKILTKGKKLNAFEFVVYHQIVCEYFSLYQGSVRRFDEVLRPFRCHAFDEDLTKHDVMWGDFFWGNFEESWCVVTSSKILKIQKEKWKKESIKNAIKKCKWAILDAKKGTFTEVLTCEKCGKFGSSKNIHFRGFTDGVIKPKRTYKLTNFYGFCCVSCWNKYKPIEKVADMANELRLKTNRAMREYQELRK